MIRDECMLLLGYKISRAEDRESLLIDSIILHAVHVKDIGL